jgi:ATP-dependent Lon protease
MSIEEIVVPSTEKTLLNLPVLPLRDVVIYPDMIMPLFVGRARSIRALDEALINYNKRIVMVAQKDSSVNDPVVNDLYMVGTICIVLQMIKLPDGTVKILTEGEKRIKVVAFQENKDHLTAQVEELTSIQDPKANQENILKNLVFSTFERYLDYNKDLPSEILNPLSEIKQLGSLVDAIAAHIPFKIEDKQKLLEMLDTSQRAKHLLVVINSAIELLEVQQRINSRVKKRINAMQKAHFLNEQMKAIQQELAESEGGEGSGIDEIRDLTKKIAESGMSAEASDKAKKELEKLKMMSPLSAEATVVRHYIDWLIALPWKADTKVAYSLKRAEAILNKEHYGLEKVKERIVEYLAVLKRVKSPKSPILCLVGPPGVGKTSLAQSIAHATGRKYVRMSLGGVRDEAEIRGHRRTYIGAMPGKIIQNMKKAGVRNPLFLLDEVDKIAMDFRGDPAAALLEVLDPEQNHMFNDHFLEVDYDLSHVMFVATANNLDIHPALLDRMEVIHLAGYTEDEKLNIALKHLLAKQLKLNGLSRKELQISSAAFLDIIRYYTREPGVRSLERELSKICRKVVKNLISDGKIKSVKVTPDQLEEYLGVRRYRFGSAGKKDQVGQVTGLAWTEVGGELLTVEAATMIGTGKAIITGQLGNVMQESIQAAMTIVKSRARQLGIDPAFFEKHDIHIHVPEGAIPKDGPSAGITMCTALVSILTNIPVYANVAMTGEITLRGEVLPIGGLKEKLLAARRGGIQQVMIPAENEKDLKEIPENVKKDLQIYPVRWIEEVLKIALVRLPEPLSEKALPITLVSDKKKRTILAKERKENQELFKN